MRTDELLLVGAGGHGKVAADALLRLGTPFRWADHDPARTGSVLLGKTISQVPQENTLKGIPFHIAIGDDNTRRSLHMAMLEHGASAMTIVHPRATIADCNDIGDGSFIAANAIIAPHAKIGYCTIINHGAIVDHDCEVGGFTHIAPNVTLGGNVKVGGGSLIGAGTTILPGINVGANACVAAGSTIIEDVAESETVIFAQTRKK